MIGLEVNFRDFGIEIEVQPEDKPGINYGILFRSSGSSDTDSQYLFAVTTDGTCYLGKIVRGKWADPFPVGETPSPHIKSGSAKNRLGVLAEGSRISLYINGNLVKTINDDSLASGQVGVFVASTKSDQAQVVFNRLTVYTVEKAKQDWGAPAAITPSPRATTALPAGVLFQDDFASEQASKAKGWEFETSTAADYVWSSNKLTVTVKQAQSLATMPVPAGTFKDLGIEIEAQPANNPGTEYGILFRFGGELNARNYYLFGVTPDGKYQLYKRINGKWVEPDPVAKTSSAYVQAGASKNRLGVLVEGATISLYINGNLIKTISDDALKSGEVRLYVGAGGDRASVAFSRVTLYSVEKAKAELGKR